MYEQLGIGKATKGSKGTEGTQENPAQPKTQEDFDGLKAGMWFVNPKDGRVLRKK
jgi:hypothetical protein